MSELKQVLMERDEMTSSQADELIEELKMRVRKGENPEELLLEECGLEPDYFLDLL